jgi:hypothetical protein
VVRFRKRKLKKTRRSILNTSAEPLYNVEKLKVFPHFKVINTDEVPLDAEISAIFVNAGHHQACSIELTRK